VAWGGLGFGALTEGLGEDGVGDPDVVRRGCLASSPDDAEERCGVVPWSSSLPAPEDVWVEVAMPKEAVTAPTTPSEARPV
jgi:hypothetical protein